VQIRRREDSALPSQRTVTDRLLNVSAHGCTAAGLVTTALIRTSEPHIARWKLVDCRTVVIGP